MSRSAGDERYRRLPCDSGVRVRRVCHSRFVPQMHDPDPGPRKSSQRLVQVIPDQRKYPVDPKPDQRRCKDFGSSRHVRS